MIKVHGWRKQDFRGADEAEEEEDLAEVKES